MRKNRRYLVAAIALAVVALGVVGVVHGEADDSPGLQLIGGALIVGALFFGVRALRRGRQH
ncbi:hypothetical protein [Micromonospora sp. DT233]|uniref:hypothetical protein n=1 Tax=Micromonospora sp. DT233 TaxID=3393432 RepID=UPI003CF7E866